MSNDECKNLTKSEWKKWIGVVGRMLLAYALIFAQGAWAAQDQKTKDKAGSPQKAAATQTGEKQASTAISAKAQSKQTQLEESENSVAEEKPSRDGSHEGIKVHGHWTIEVRNPDGTVVTHREFENTLVTGAGGPNGSQLLAQVLGHAIVVGSWSIALTVNALNGSCSANTVCLIEEPVPSFTSAPGYSNNLAVSLTNSGNSLTLTGSVTVPSALQITGVETNLSACGGGLSPVGCFQALPAAMTSYFFTLATVTQSVQAGQIVAVTVILSFS